MLTKQKLAELLKQDIQKTDPQVSEEDIEIFLSEYKGEDMIIRSDSLIEEIKKRGPRPSMSTEISDLDQITSGFFEEQVVVVTAYPKSGKTAFCLHLIDLMKKYHPVFLALEQSPYELVEQLIQNGSKVPVFYAPRSIDTIRRTTDWIYSKVLEAQFKSKKDYGEKTKMVFIDHFGYINRNHTSDQATWEIINTMQDLKTIAKQTKTCLVVIVHTVKPDEFEPPTTKDLFGSAGYHQEADLVLSLWRETYKEDKEIKRTKNVLLQVLANRKTGNTGAVKFTFDNGNFIRKNWLPERDRRNEEELESFKNSFNA